MSMLKTKRLVNQSSKPPPDSMNLAVSLSLMNLEVKLRGTFGDPIYQRNPLIARFDLFVGNPPLSIPFDRAVLH